MKVPRYIIVYNRYIIESSEIYNIQYSSFVKKTITKIIAVVSSKTADLQWVNFQLSYAAQNVLSDKFYISNL